MFTVLIAALIGSTMADSVRYQVKVTPLTYNDASAFTSTGAARIVTVNLGLENCASPSAEQPCGWGMARSAGYAAHTGKNYYSGGQRNAFGVSKASENLAGFWADSALQTDDLPGDLLTLEKDLRVEYGNSAQRFKTAKTLVNGIHQGSSPIYVSGALNVNEESDFGACFRLFDNSPADRPNSFDLVATGAYSTGKPSSVESDVVFGFWANGVVGTLTADETTAFYASADVKPSVAADAASEAVVRAALGQRQNLALDAVEQKFAQPVLGVNGAEIVNDEVSTSGFAQEARTVAVFPLVYHKATATTNDRVRQACAMNAAGSCVFRPVAYATTTPCDFGAHKRAVAQYML